MKTTKEHWDKICEITDYINNGIKPYVRNSIQLSKEEINIIGYLISNTITKLKTFKNAIKHHSYPDYFDEEGKLIKK